MRQIQKKSLITAALFALLTTSVGCVAYDDNYRGNRTDRSSRLDLDRDGRVEQWERDRWDRDGDGRVEQWERDRGPLFAHQSESKQPERYVSKVGAFPVAGSGEGPHCIRQGTTAG